MCEMTVPNKKKEKKNGCSCDIFRLPRSAHVRQWRGALGCFGACVCVKRVSVQGANTNSCGWVAWRGVVWCDGGDRGKWSSSVTGVGWGGISVEPLP